MKTFEQLIETEQAKAIEKCLYFILEDVVSGAIRFNDSLNENTIQSRIDAAQEKAEKMQTTWFAHEYILDTCREDLEGMARCEAEDALYSIPGERVISGIAS